MAKIVDIEGIGPAYAAKLQAAGIQSTEALLKAGATPKNRKELAEKTGISGDLILEWVNHADLYRIKGVGSEYSDLLEEAGVDTVVELAHRNAQNLLEKMTEANEEKNLVRRLPTLSMVTRWIEQAKTLPRAVEY
jgi:predicted flap endonuclease-1-like 5' DNA nuclease